MCVCARSGCGTLVLVEDKASIHSPNHPQAYSNDCVLRWVIHAPLGLVVKVSCTTYLPGILLKVLLGHVWLKAGWFLYLQLEFTDFDLEESERCLYDSLTVLGDVEGTEEIGRTDTSNQNPSFYTCITQYLVAFLCLALLCGGSIPPPVLSYHSTMVLQFTSDSSITHRGFRATLTFISITGTPLHVCFPPLSNY